MNLKAIFNVVGILLILLSGILLVPLAVSLFYADPALPGHLTPMIAFLGSCIASGVTGFILWKLLPSGIEKLREREGFVIVGVAWIIITFFGALPFYLTGVCPEFVDAYFESMSGFTTTGASILTSIDTLPHGILFWRNMMQWLGGMGIIILSLAIFPALGIGSFQLFKAEIPGGATVERMKPRLAETAKVLWKTYVVLTLAEIILLKVGGMGLFDAVCHTFSTVATGGFSPYQASVGHFNNLYFETVIILFMFLGGMNFALHYHLIQGNIKVVFQNPEFRFYVTMIVIAITVTTLGLAYANDDTLEHSFRRAAFNVVSINTTTGYATDDFNLWPDYLRIMMVVIMMVGGCSGSTSGSFKIIRVIILFKVVLRELQKLVHPRAVVRIKVGQKPLPPDYVMNVVALAGLFLGLAGAGFIALAFMGVDLTTALSASIACLFNIGPGMGHVGPAADYASLPEGGKWILVLWMLMGRLEIFGILLLFLPMTWRK